MSDEHIVKSHNRTLLLYHLVLPAKCRLKVFTPEVEETLRQVCLRIEECYEIRFVEIGMEADHVHFLVQGVPTMTVSTIVKTIKSITAREIFKAHPGLKKDLLWGGSVWTSGYYTNTVGLYASKETIRHYIQNQGKDGGEYRKVYENQPELDFGG